MANRNRTGFGLNERFAELVPGTGNEWAQVVCPPGDAITLLASAAVAAAGTVTGTGISGFGSYRRGVFLLVVSAAATDANDTLDVYIDVSPDGGTTYVNAIHFTQVLGNGGAVKYWAALDPSGSPGTSVIAVTSDAAAGAARPQLWGSHIRVRHVIVDPTGSNVSFTFGVYAYVQ